MNPKNYRNFLILKFFLKRKGKLGARREPYVPLESGRNVFAQPPTLTREILSAEGF